MNIKPIRNENDYQQALKRIDELWDAEPDTAKGDELDVLTSLICAYEEKIYPGNAGVPPAKKSKLF